MKMLKLLLIQLGLIVISGASDVPLLKLPISTDPNDVQFYLYPNPTNFSDFDILTYQNLSSVTDSRFSTVKSNIFLTHGFTQSFTSDFPTYLIQAYLNAEFGNNWNLIAVDWGKLSGAATPLAPSFVGTLQNLPLYIEVVGNVPIVGKRLSDFIVFLQNNGQISGPSQVHLIGQSLGAHVSGIAGMEYKKSTGSKLDRITGTDPAGPLFQDKPFNRRLDATDANFVDIVHTNEAEFGYVGPLGKVDFFINGGGPIQPACIPSLPTNTFCSHNSAPHYYAQSITNSSLIGSGGFFRTRKAVFGEFCPKTTAGIFHISLKLTSAEVPPPGGSPSA